MRTEHEGSFYVQLPLVDGLKIVADSKLAFRLYFWYVGRITVEYRTAWGIRCGGVLGLSPQVDPTVAADIARCSQENCTGWTVRSWRRALAKLGLIAWKRTPVGLRVFVIGSNKMPDAKLKELPNWAEAVLSETVRVYLARYGRYARIAHRPVEDCPSDRQEMAHRPANVRPSNKRKEVESEFETEKTTQQPSRQHTQTKNKALPSEGGAERREELARQFMAQKCPFCGAKGKMSNEGNGRVSCEDCDRVFDAPLCLELRNMVIVSIKRRQGDKGPAQSF